MVLERKMLHGAHIFVELITVGIELWSGSQTRAKQVPRFPKEMGDLRADAVTCEARSLLEKFSHRLPGVDAADRLTEQGRDRQDGELGEPFVRRQRHGIGDDDFPHVALG